MKANLRDFIYIAIIIALILFAHDRDYNALIKPQVEAAKAQKSRCPERDVLGRQLVATYYAYSDSIQTFRCTYSKRIFT